MTIPQFIIDQIDPVLCIHIYAGDEDTNPDNSTTGGWMFFEGKPGGMEIFIAYGNNKRLENVPNKWRMKAINARSIQVAWDSYKDVLRTASYTN